MAGMGPTQPHPPLAWTVTGCCSARAGHTNSVSFPSSQCTPETSPCSGLALDPGPPPHRLLPFKNVEHALGVAESLSFFVRLTPPVLSWTPELAASVNDALELAKLSEASLIEQLPPSRWARAAPRPLAQGGLGLYWQRLSVSDEWLGLHAGALAIPQAQCFARVAVPPGLACHHFVAPTAAGPAQPGLACLRKRRDMLRVRSSMRPPGQPSCNRLHRQSLIYLNLSFYSAAVVYWSKRARNLITNDLKGEMNVTWARARTCAPQVRHP